MAGNTQDFSDIVGGLTNFGQYGNLAGQYNSQALDSILPEILGTAGAQNQAQQAYSGQQNQLLTSLFQQFGPQLAATGAQIGGQTQQAQATNNAATANSSAGQAALQASIAADKAANPEFYAARQAAGGRLGDLLGSIDLSGQLSGGEQEALRRSIAQQNTQTGTANTPSQVNTASNAMQYGDATYQRQEQAKGDLSQALGEATSFLPASQSQVGGMNAWNTATGGANTTTNTANAGLGLFGGPNNYSGLTNTSNQNNLAGILNSALGGAVSSSNTNLTSNNQVLGDQMQATSSMLGSLGGMGSSAMK